MTGTRKPTATEKKALAKKAAQNHEGVLPSYDRFGGILDQLPEWSAEYLSLNAQIKELEEKKDEIKNNIHAVMLECGENRVKTEFSRVEVVTSHRARRLSKTKLVEHGVDPDVIEECHEGGEEYQYIKVSLLEA